MITTIKQENGFSLLEVLIALVILAIGLLAIAQMQITAIKGNAYGSEMTSASSLASNTLERLMALPYTDVAPLTVPPPDASSTSVAASIVGGTLDPLGAIEGGINNQNYTRAYWVVDNSPYAGMRQITVRVAWTDSNNRVKNVTMVTQRAQ
mgnify:FL=1|jgi:type IV pilus assembly protein PilV